MSQLHFYVSEKVERRLRERAMRAGQPLSRYLAKLVKEQADQADEWPEDYFEQVFGGWQGEPLTRPPQGDYEKRATLD